MRKTQEPLSEWVLRREEICTWVSAMTRATAELLQSAMRFEVARRGVDPGRKVEREVPQDGWDQPAGTVDPNDVWSWLYKRVVSGLNPKSLIDAGCGGAQRLRWAIDANGDPPDEVTLIDASECNLEQARTALPHAQYVRARLADLTGLKPTDAVLCLEVLEHIERADLALSSCWAMVKPGGRLTISSPNRIFGIVNGWFQPNTPSGNPAHRREWTPWELVELALFCCDGGEIESVVAPWPRHCASRLADGGQAPLTDRDFMRWRVPPVWRDDPEVIAWSLTTVIAIRKGDATNAT